MVPLALEILYVPFFSYCYCFLLNQFSCLIDIVSTSSLNLLLSCYSTPLCPINIDLTNISRITMTPTLTSPFVYFSVGCFVVTHNDDCSYDTDLRRDKEPRWNLVAYEA